MTLRSSEGFDYRCGEFVGFIELVFANVDDGDTSNRGNNHQHQHHFQHRK